MKRRLVLKKQTVQNLNQGEMSKLVGGADPTCHYPTLVNYECNTVTPTVWTCAGVTCMCMSIWPVV